MKKNPKEDFSVLIPRATFNAILTAINEALESDSNDAEHDALFDVREMLWNPEETARQIGRKSK